MIEKFNKDAKVEKLTYMPGIAVRLIVIDPLYQSEWNYASQNRLTCFFQHHWFTKRHNSFKNWRKVTTVKLDLYYIKTKSRAKFQLNMSKHVGEKCGKWADGDPDGHHHTIIRPVWRQAYKIRPVWRRAYKNSNKISTLINMQNNTDVIV